MLVSLNAHRGLEQNAGYNTEIRSEQTNAKDISIKLSVALFTHHSSSSFFPSKLNFLASLVTAGCLVKGLTDYPLIYNLP